MLTDADVVDRCGQLLEAQIYRKPTASAAVPRHSADDRDDPRVVAVKDRLYMRRADVAMPQRRAVVRSKERLRSMSDFGVRPAWAQQSNRLPFSS